MGKKNILVANGSIVSASPELSEAFAKSISLHPGEAIGEKGRIANSNQANSIVLQDQSKLQHSSKEAQASLLRSDGGPRGEFLQWSSLPFNPLDVVTNPSENKIESSDGLRTPLANSIALEDRLRLQQTSKETQAPLLRSDGGPRGELFQRSHSTAAPLEVATRIPKSAIERSNDLRTH
jgi:hypothetical protein